jgi:hypothetical protein
MVLVYLLFYIFDIYHIIFSFFYYKENIISKKKLLVGGIIEIENEK